MLIEGCDPHSRKPPAFGVHAFDDENNYYILDEWPNVHKGKYRTKRNSAPTYYDQIKSFNMNYEQTLTELHNTEERWGIKPFKRYMDPRFAHNRHGDEQVIDAYNRVARELGFDMKFTVARVGRDTGEGEIASGLNMITDKLAYDPDLEIGAGNTPGLFVNPSCINHIRAFQYFKYKTEGGKTTEGKAPTEVFDTKFKDFIDIVRYAMKSAKRYRHPIVHAQSDFAPLGRDPRTGY